ncbi:MAG: hypothetical protein WCK26_02295 [Candidatus Saccharibacteria bacterium]
MNKIVIWIISGVVVVAGGVLAVVLFSNNGAKVTNTNTGQTTSVKTGNDAIISVDACDILTEIIAKQILGDAAEKSDTTNGQTSTDDVSVSNCTYTASIDPNAAVRISNKKGVGVLIRAAKTNAGIETNKTIFTTNKPAGVQDINGLGESAFFNPQFGQTNVLKGGNWYIITNYSGTAGIGTLESNKQLVDLLKLK